MNVYWAVAGVFGSPKYVLPPGIAAVRRSQLFHDYPQSRGLYFFFYKSRFINIYFGIVIWSVGIAAGARDPLFAEGDGEPAQSGEQPGLRADAEIGDVRRHSNDGLPLQKEHERFQNVE